MNYVYTSKSRKGRQDMFFYFTNFILCQISQDRSLIFFFFFFHENTLRREDIEKSQNNNKSQIKVKQSMTLFH